MNALIRTGKFLVLAQIAYGPALAAQWGAAASIPFGIALAAAAALYFSQPDIRVTEIRRDASRDRMSALLILFAGLVAHALPAWEWRLRGFPGMEGPLQVAGVVLVVSGLIWRIRSIRILGRFFSATVRIRNDHRLISQGPYHWSRHPSYLGALIAMIGHALVLGAPGSALGVAAVLIPVYSYRIRVEEAALIQAFGSEYRAYSRSTARLIPFIW